MAKKIYDVCVATGVYKDSTTGADKKRWLPVGSILQNDDNSCFMLLEKYVNFAGIPCLNPEKQNSSSVICSLFAPKNHEQQQAQQPKSNEQFPF